MPKIPYKTEKSQDDEDYEIVSFEDFCDKSPNSKTDLLTLNDNINYKLCYENENAAKFYENDGEGCSRGLDSETSLGGSKNVTFKRKLSNSFAPFGRSGQNTKSSLFSGVIPKPRNEGDATGREHRYERFSGNRSVVQRLWDSVPGLGSGLLGILLVCLLCVAVWWAVDGALGGGWREQHYKKLWERAHPDAIKKPLSPIPFDKVSPEYHYHDHNNLSTKNKNGTEPPRKKDSWEGGACADVREAERFDCHPQPGASEELCTKRGCCWLAAAAARAPWCFFPRGFRTLRFLNLTENKHGLRAHYAAARPSGYPGDFRLVRMDFNYLSDYILHIKIVDAEHARFESPFPEIPAVSAPVTALAYAVLVDSGGVGFSIVRTQDNVTIFNAQDVGGLILSDRFLQLSALLSSPYVFGLGEKRGRFLNSMDWNTITMFNNDMPPTENVNLYGSHPFYLGVEESGMSHGVLLDNSNAIDVVLQPAPGITFRAIGGVLQLVVLLGPAPGAVLRQYSAAAGAPALPPYWALGFHLCKFKYPDLNTTMEVWKRTRDAEIPFDTQWNDIDYMDRNNDFSLSPHYAALPAFVNKLHEVGMHYVMIIDPGVSGSEPPGSYPPLDRGLEMDVFIKNSTGQPFVGKVWNLRSTVFPDFTHPNASAYWLEMLARYHRQVPFDGVWIDMNEISNFVSGALHGSCAPEDLPYRPHTIGRDGLRTKTLCMDAKHYRGPHYDWHNLHANTEAMATHFVLSQLRGRRPLVISRASSPGLGHYAGHWSGDVASTWSDLAFSIPELLSFSLFGVPLMGADICGFRGDTTAQLCARWTQLGAFYPFSRNHNSDTSIPQDPVALGPAVAGAARRWLRVRYSLLPYYYLMFWRAHVYGDTVARPLFFEEPSNPSLFAIDSQFLVGPALLVSPVLAPGAASTRAVLPTGDGWFSLADGAFLGSNQTVTLGEDDIAAVRGGSVLVLQEPPARGPVTTSNTRSCNMQLLATPCPMGRAAGELYWDDGDSLNSYEEKKYSLISFKLNNTELRSEIQWWGHGVPPVDRITLLRQPRGIRLITINGVPCERPCNVVYQPDKQRVDVQNISLALDKPFTVRWTYRLARQSKRVNSVRIGNETVLVCKSNNCS